VINVPIVNSTGFRWRPWLSRTGTACWAGQRVKLHQNIHLSIIDWRHGEAHPTILDARAS